MISTDPTVSWEEDRKQNFELEANVLEIPSDQREHSKAFLITGHGLAILQP